MSSYLPMSIKRAGFTRHAILVTSGGTYELWIGVGIARDVDPVTMIAHTHRDGSDDRVTKWYVTHTVNGRIWWNQCTVNSTAFYPIASMAAPSNLGDICNQLFAVASLEDPAS